MDWFLDAAVLIQHTKEGSERVGRDQWKTIQRKSGSNTFWSQRDNKSVKNSKDNKENEGWRNASGFEQI